MNRLLYRFSLLVALACALQAEPAAPSIKAVAFDAFPVFDPRPIAKVALELFPEQGHELLRLWRQRQFEYQWLRALGGNYQDFMRTTEDALVFAARQTGVSLTPDLRHQLMAPYRSLRAWPDARKALTQLKADGYKLVFLSNMTDEMLTTGLDASGLNDLFDAVYSTDSQRTFKPSPVAYQIAIDKLGLSREEILFVAFAGWDAAGAKWFGYPTFWVNRAGSPAEELAASPDGIGPDLQSLVNFLAETAAKR
jgi:2-haloacid dehalogenase